MPCRACPRRVRGGGQVDAETPRRYSLLWKSVFAALLSLPHKGEGRRGRRASRRKNGLGPAGLAVGARLRFSHFVSASPAGHPGNTLSFFEAPFFQGVCPAEPAPEGRWGGGQVDAKKPHCCGSPCSSRVSALLSLPQKGEGRRASRRQSEGGRPTQAALFTLCFRRSRWSPRQHFVVFSSPRSSRVSALLSLPQKGEGRRASRRQSGGGRPTQAALFTLCFRRSRWSPRQHFVVFSSPRSLQGVCPAEPAPEG
ncbi:hypothetical protein ROHU_037154 [Labeo rohita]|uniref:Uncharacterized protein n=1 Tax=Labeo rohita TaxID=84645 RepID=A0A498M6K4_LABRO|nr:hypothetical protein ROHU_037154 [Labeo rohita]